MRKYGRQPVQSNPQMKRVSIGKAIPAPVGGWDAQSPIANMPPENAVILDNWIPRAGFVETRRGSAAWSVGIPAPVETGMVLRGIGDDLIFAAAGDDIYDVSFQGDAPVSVYTGTGSARFQWINFANDGGTFILAANGANDPIYFDGTTWASLVITGASGAVTLDPAQLIDVMEHKARTFWVENASLRVWYLAPNAIQGAAGLLDLGPIFDKGGTVICQANWTVDGGAGADDLAVWVTSEGQVAVYQGLDPSDANDWALVGVYDLGLPLSRRSLIKYGSDLVVLTTDGVVPLSQALKLDRAQENLVALTQRIQLAFQNAQRAFRNNFGWEGCLYSRGALAIFNIPISELTNSVQYVQNVQTGAWCRFTGLNAFCWFTANDNIMFGAVDGIYQWDTGATDNGVQIIADLKTSFNYFGSRGTLKKFEMLQPILRSSSDLQPAVEILTDFREAIPVATPTVVIPEGGLWNQGLWDGALWSNSVDIRDGWTSVTGIGYCGSVRMRLTADIGTYFDVAIGDGSLLGVTEGGDAVEISLDIRGEAVLEVLAFNLKFQNQSGGQL